MYVHPATSYICKHYTYYKINWYKAFLKWTAIEESSSTYIRGLSKINANILGI